MVSISWYMGYLKGYLGGVGIKNLTSVSGKIPCIWVLEPLGPGIMGMHYPGKVPGDSGLECCAYRALVSSTTWVTHVAASTN